MDYINDMTLGEKLKKLRKGRGLTQVQFAGILGMKQQLLARYETDRSIPTIKKIAQLANALGVAIGDLVSDDDLEITAEIGHLHKNSRTAQISAHFEKLKPADQRAILKQVKSLIAQY